MHLKIASWMTVILIAASPLPALAQGDATAAGVTARSSDAVSLAAPSRRDAARNRPALRRDLRDKVRDDRRRAFRRDTRAARRDYAQDRRLKQPERRRDIRRRGVRPNGGPGRARANPARIRNYKAKQKQRRRRAAAANR